MQSKIKDSWLSFWPIWALLLIKVLLWLQCYHYWILNICTKSMCFFTMVYNTSAVKSLNQKNLLLKEECWEKLYSAKLKFSSLLLSQTQWCTSRFQCQLHLNKCLHLGFCFCIRYLITKDSLHSDIIQRAILPLKFYKHQFFFYLC